MEGTMAAFEALTVLREGIALTLTLSAAAL